MPKIYETNARKIVLAVRDFCEKEKANKGPLIPFDNVRQRVAAMTGVSEKTVSNITKEAVIAASTPETNSTPKKKRKAQIVDDNELSIIRNKIHEIYTVRKEVPTLDKLLAELEVDINFKGGRTTLWKIIRKLGFRLKRGTKRKDPMERDDIEANASTEQPISQLDDIKSYYVIVVNNESDTIPSLL